MYPDWSRWGGSMLWLFIRCWSHLLKITPRRTEATPHQQGFPLKRFKGHSLICVHSVKKVWPSFCVKKLFEAILLISLPRSTCWCFLRTSGSAKYGPKFQGELIGYRAVSILATCYLAVSAISQVSALAIDWRGDDGRHMGWQMSHFFYPFPIQILTSKAIPTDFPLFSNSLLPFSPDNLYSHKKLDWLGLCRKPWFWDNWGWQRCRPGVKIPIREQRLLCPIRSQQHFFREFETNYNYTGSLC